MKCLIKYRWVKLPRDIDSNAKGLMTCYTRLATRSAFRKGKAHYCGVENPVVPGMWAGAIAYPGGAYTVYNYREGMVKWMGEGKYNL